MHAAIKQSLLFAHMQEHEIEDCLKCCGAYLAEYGKEEFVFHQQDIPTTLFVLLEGAVAVCRDTAFGKRVVVTTISEPGDLFGEVYLFLQHKEYDNSAVAVNGARVLQMPKEFFYKTCENACGAHALLIRNMLSILAQKAFYLNKKLQIVAGATLRQKISRVLLQEVSAEGVVKLDMTREEFADFLNVARPSLSRELMKMQREGFLQVSGGSIKILNPEELQACL